MNQVLVILFILFSTTSCSVEQPPKNPREDTGGSYIRYRIVCIDRVEYIVYGRGNASSLTPHLRYSKDSPVGFITRCRSD